MSSSFRKTIQIGVSQGDRPATEPPASPLAGAAPPAMLSSAREGRVWDDTAFAAAAARPTSGTICHMLWPWAHGPSDWIAELAPEGFLSPTRVLRAEEHERALAAAEETRFNSSTNWLETQQGDTRALVDNTGLGVHHARDSGLGVHAEADHHHHHHHTHHNRFDHSQDPEKARRERREEALDAQERQFQQLKKAKQAQLNAAREARGEAAGDYDARARELRAMRHLAAVDLNDFRAAVQPTHLDHQKNPRLQDFNHNVEQSLSFRIKRANAAGLLVTSGNIEYQQYYQGLSARQRADYEQFDAGHCKSIPDAKMFLKSPNVHKDVTTVCKGGDMKYGSFGRRTEVSDAVDLKLLANIHESRQVVALGPFKLYN